MKHCSHCGTPAEDQSDVCEKCGRKLPSRFWTTDSTSRWWLVLGLILPIVGFVLFLLWRKTTPMRAKNLGKGALIGAIILVVIAILYVGFVFWVVYALANGLSNAFSS